MATDLYIRLSYDEYKAFESALRNFQDRETEHTNVEKTFYHKSFRLPLGGIALEVHGPLVKP